MYVCMYVCMYVMSTMVSLRKEIQYTLLNRELKGLLELKMQGWLIDLKTCHYLLSQDIFKMQFGAMHL